ncbi:hypothetical protein A2W32_02390 [candidate division WWE3 bacterium RBG_16_37_10]|uniref:Uncharacterized protein n=1 Tax=candidate division WWE3 bacterium RBG_16_37_10 TaxID=1802610 RepID=A0A1F4V1J8_UNCKA|nr:MAG: hypothetical protein A2W32_02390 [candidate division WWE3 bacterium RBG_16_37_10]
MDDSLYNCSFLLSYINPKVQVLIILLFLTLVLVLLRKKVDFENLKKKKIYMLPLILIALGGFINLFQRFFYGCVYDNLSFFSLFKYNIWDLIVVSGLTIVFVKNKWYFRTK